jgi:hypothetical protein
MKAVERIEVRNSRAKGRGGKAAESLKNETLRFQGVHGPGVARRANACAPCGRRHGFRLRRPSGLRSPRKNQPESPLLHDLQAGWLRKLDETAEKPL